MIIIIIICIIIIITMIIMIRMIYFHPSLEQVARLQSPSELDDDAASTISSKANLVSRWVASVRNLNMKRRKVKIMDLFGAGSL